MKKLFFLFVALLATTSLWAEDFSVGGIYYNILGRNNVEVTYRGNCIGSYEEYSGAVTIPASVTYNGITYSVTSIGDGAFQDCSSLTSVTIGNSVTSIGKRAFLYCRSLTSITIPNSVTSIGTSAFSACSSLNSIVVESGNATYDSRNNCNALIETATNRLIAGCQNTIIPNSVTSIGSYAFEECSSLTSITIPNSVTTIGGVAFCNCSSLTSVTIGNSVTYIGESAFYGCSSLNEVTLGTGLKTIGEEAFAGCSKLQDVYCYAVEPPTAYDSSFSQYNAFLYIPCENKKVYMLDEVFGNFKYIECISSDEVSTNDIVVTPGTNDVTITWPTEGNADTYTIVIKKDGVVFCTLTFNADGQLLNIAFAPGRGGNNHPAQYAEQAGNGYRFTVTGLEESTHYAYNIDVRDIADKTINSHAGEFTTQSITAVDNIQSPVTTCQKIMHNGQLIILRDGKEYNAMGKEIQ